MTQKQLYMIGGGVGLILIILVTLVSYYNVKYRKTYKDFLAEQTDRMKYAEESATRLRQLNQTKEELAAKVSKIEYLQGLIDEEQQRSAKLSEAKKQIEAEKARLEAEKRKREEESRDLINSLQKEIQNKEIKITELRGMLTVNLMDKILFDSGRSEIKPAGKRVLDKIAKTFLNRYPDREIRVEGHSDNVPYKGSRLNNWGLSTARAISAVRYLQEHASVAPARLAAVGYAHYRPIDTNDTSDGRARNRRIEIIVMPPKKADSQ